MNPHISTDDVVSVSRTSVMLAVLAGARTYAGLIAATGLTRATLHHHLHALRDAGLVDFEDYLQGTLRASAKLVAMS